MKKYAFVILLLLCVSDLFASHIVGGEVFYTYLGELSGTTKSRYRLSVRLFRDCNVDCGGNTNVACLPASVFVGVFSNVSPYADAGTYTLNLVSSCHPLAWRNAW